MPRARTLLMIPDLLGYWLTGRSARSYQRVDDRAARRCRADLGVRADGRPGSRPPVPASTAAGRRDRAVNGTADGAAGSCRWSPSGRTTPRPRWPRYRRTGPNFAYISCGTWSLVGMELGRPVVTEASRAANFTNEAGHRRDRPLPAQRLGLWLLQECQRHWGSSARPLDALLAKAAATEPLRFVIDADDPVFMSPGDMPSRITDWLTTRGAPAPQDARPSSFGASWTAWLWPTGGRCSPSNRCPASMPTSCTSSVAAPATGCYASSPRMRSGCPSSPAQRKPQLWAMCWFRRVHWALRRIPWKG